MKKYLGVLFLFVSGFYAHEPVDFVESMLPNKNFKSVLLSESDDWRLISNLYEEYQKKSEYSEQPRIPKIIHQIWLGSPLPARYAELQRTWKLYHPNWEYRLWNDAQVEAFLLEKEGIEYLNKYFATENWGERSDIARYVILREMGGLYIDTDFECLKSFDYLHHTLEFYTGIALDEALIFFNGLIGSKPHHPIIEECVKKIRGKTPGTFSRSEEIMERTGPFHLTRAILNNINDESNYIVAFPNTFFYPLPNYAKGTQLSLWIKPESYAVHYWDQSWCPRG